MGVKIKTADVRYITYTLTFPDGDRWVDQTPMIHDLYFTLDNSQFRNHPNIKNALLTKGEFHWRDVAKVEHHIKIEDEQRPRVWGTKRELFK